MAHGLGSSEDLSHGLGDTAGGAAAGAVGIGAAVALTIRQPREEEDGWTDAARSRERKERRGCCTRIDDQRMRHQRAE